MLQKKPYIIDFSTFGDTETGVRTVAEYAASLPFEPQRIYWLYKTPKDYARDNAANKTCKFVMVCLHGKAKIHIEDLKSNSYNFELDSPEVGLVVPELHWRRIDLEEDAMLLCIASDRFEDRDCILDFKEFMKYKKLKM